jgi:hypothetical protein
MTAPTITLNTEQELYVIPQSGGGYSCLGFDVLIERYNRLAIELNDPQYPQFSPQERGTLDGYARYTALLDSARKSNRRFTCELSPQLTGLEGHRVEVVTTYGETRRFNVGKSTGWLPIHLEIHNRRSTGGGSAERTYTTVRDLGKVR